jgi:hypothetical protein
MPDPMTDDERALLEHRWAVRVSLPSQASHADRGSSQSICGLPGLV